MEAIGNKAQTVSQKTVDKFNSTKCLKIENRLRESWPCFRNQICTKKPEYLTRICIRKNLKIKFYTAIRVRCFISSSDIDVFKRLR